MNKNRIVLCLIFTALLFSCKKGKDLPSSTNSIISFKFGIYDNPGLFSDIAGRINGDTISATVPPAATLSALIPSITHNGVGITPAGKIKQDFTHPVTYTVTAADGSIKKYIVVVRVADSTKEIISFILKNKDNPGLPADITGEIVNDTIAITLPAGVNTTNLHPAITYAGKSLSPDGGQPQNFIDPILYTVTAEDGTTRKYLVMASANSTVYTGSRDDYIYALDARTGRLKWKYKTGTFANSTPALYNNNLYVGGADGYLYNLNPQTGELNWKFRTEVDIGIPGSPVFYNGNVIFAAWNNSVNDLGPGAIYSVNAATGALNWKCYIPDAINPAVMNGVVYCATFSSGIWAINAETGTVLWKYNAGLMRGEVCVKDGTVFAGSEYNGLIALNGETGELKWESDPTSVTHTTPTSPTIENDVLYAGVGGQLVGVSVSDGSEEWRFDTNHGGGDPIIYNGVLYTGNPYGAVYAINLSSKTLKWKYGEGLGILGILFTQVTAANGIVYSSSFDHYINAINAETGALVWRFLAGDDVYAGFLVTDSGNNLYYSGLSGNKQ